MNRGVMGIWIQGLGSDPHVSLLEEKRKKLAGVNIPDSALLWLLSVLLSEWTYLLP